MPPARLARSRLPPETVALATALWQRDPVTGSHCDRTHSLALELGRAVAVPQCDLTTLGLAAQLHDIGKIGIPDTVLLKPGRFSPSELEVMMTHAQRGHDILVTVPNDRIVAVAKVVLHHHEAFDGQGYPHGLQGEAIPPLARIIAIADSYDAMATERPYHHARSHDSIMRILFEEEAGKYDPYLVTKFAALIETSPYRSQGRTLQ